MVVEKGEDAVLVRVARVNCAQCGGCGLLSRDRERSMEFWARDRAGAEVGDEVLLRVPSRRVIAFYLLLFGVPLSCMAVAYLAVFLFFRLAGGVFLEGYAVIACVVAGLLGLFAGSRLAARQGISPAVESVLGKACEGEGGEPYRGKVL